MKEETTPLTVWGLWEFCFYNLPPEEVNRDVELKDLWKALESDFREFHRRATARETQADLVAKMRKTYRDIFGDSAKQRNDISLITYTGPVGRNLLSRGICPAPLSKLYPAGDDARPKHVAPDQTQLRCHFEWTAGAGWRTVFDSSKPSLLYTGDITLTDPRTNEVKRLLTDIRWNNIEVFQVPHHGAKDSWKIKPASVGLFTHRYSVFSSARYHDKYFHPRDKVLEDLKNTTRILVNEYTGAVFHGCAMWRASK